MLQMDLESTTLVNLILYMTQNKKIALNKCKWELDDGKGNRGNEHAQLKIVYPKIRLLFIFKIQMWKNNKSYF